MRRTWVQLDVPRDATSCKGCGWRRVDCQDGEPGEVDLRCCEVCSHQPVDDPPASTEGMSVGAEGGVPESRRASPAGGRGQGGQIDGRHDAQFDLVSGC